MRTTLTFLAGLICATLLGQTRLQRGALDPNYYTGGGTGTIRVTCAVNPCEVDTLPGVVPTLPGTNDWRGANLFQRASLTSPFRVESSLPPACNAQDVEWIWISATRRLYVCVPPGVWLAVTQ